MLTKMYYDFKPLIAPYYVASSILAMTHRSDSKLFILILKEAKPGLLI